MDEKAFRSRRQFFKRRARLFARDEDGGSTIEFVAWLPFFLMLIVLAFDIAITFYSMGRMWDVARYTARGSATGEMTLLEAHAFAKNSLPGHADFVVNINDNEPFTVTVSISSSNISPGVGFLEMFSPEQLTASYVMRKEAF